MLPNFSNKLTKKLKDRRQGYFWLFLGSLIGIDSGTASFSVLSCLPFCSIYCCLCAKEIISRFCSPQIKMAPFIILLLLASSLTPAYAQFQSNDQAFISLLITKNGLDFVKDMLVNEAISSIIPLRLPKIEKTLKIPVVGNVYIALSDITVYQIEVPSSYIVPGEDGISIIASGTTCNLSMNWYYSYSTWLLPVEVSDEGSASIKV